MRRGPGVHADSRPGGQRYLFYDCQVLSLDVQSCSRLQRSHLGLRAVADLPAVMDELVGEGDPAALRQNPHQFLLDLLGRVAFGQAEAAGDAKTCVSTTTPSALP